MGCGKNGKHKIGVKKVAKKTTVKKKPAVEVTYKKIKVKKKK